MGQEGHGSLRNWHMRKNGFNLFWFVPHGVSGGLHKADISTKSAGSAQCLPRPAYLTPLNRDPRAVCRIWLLPSALLAILQHWGEQRSDIWKNICLTSLPPRDCVCCNTQDFLEGRCSFIKTAMPWDVFGVYKHNTKHAVWNIMQHTVYLIVCYLPVCLN